MKNPNKNPAPKVHSGGVAKPKNIVKLLKMPFYRSNDYRFHYTEILYRHGYMVKGCFGLNLLTIANL